MIIKRRTSGARPEAASGRNDETRNSAWSPRDPHRGTRGGERHPLLEPDLVDGGVARTRAGTSAFGPDQTKNDPDGTVEHDERVKVTGVAPGAYDARLKLADGRECTVKGVRVEAGKVFTIEEKELVGCSK
jgi:hypothetical protein